MYYGNSEKSEYNQERIMRQSSKAFSIKHKPIIPFAQLYLVEQIIFSCSKYGGCVRKSTFFVGTNNVTVPFFYRQSLNMGYLAIFIIFLTSTLCYKLAKCDGCPSLQVSEHNCICEPTTAGQLKFAEGNLLVCDGYDWNTLQYEPPAYGSKKNPGSSCQDIKTNEQEAANGVYWIALQPSRCSRWLIKAFGRRIGHIRQKLFFFSFY